MGAHGVLWPERSVSAQQHREHTAAHSTHPQTQHKPLQEFERLSIKQSKSHPLPTLPIEISEASSEASTPIRARHASALSLSAETASTSTSVSTSTVASIREGLELCCSVLSQMEPEIRALTGTEAQSTQSEQAMVMAAMARLSGMVQNMESSLQKQQSSA